MVGQKGNITRPVSQGRQWKGDHIEPVVEVLPEFPFLDHVGQILVGGGDDPDIHVDEPIPTHAADLPLLQDPKQLGL